MVETPAPLSETQNGPVGLAARPQGLTRLGSVFWAMPAMSESMFVCRKELADRRARISNPSMVGRNEAGGLDPRRAVRARETRRNSLRIIHRSLEDKKG